MVRNYVRKNPSILSYSEEDMVRALLDIQNGTSIRVAAQRYNIPRATIQTRLKGQFQSPRKLGKKTALLKNEELDLAMHLATLGDFGLAFDIPNLQDFVKYYLDNSGRNCPLFNDNRPGRDWVSGFLKRMENILTRRLCQNISRKRAAVSEEIVQEFFNNLKITLQNVPPKNIVNYDETNLTDDPKGKLQIFRRGAKHAERILNTSKSTISIMFAITASGKHLSPYVIYKAERMQDSYVMGGPTDARYGRTSTGWFDSDSFLDWFRGVYLPYIKTLPIEEPKVLIGDNLPSHININIIKECTANNIRMCFLPPNSTHLLQPLDVAVFAVLKKEWNKVLTNWKLGEGQHYTTLPKNRFPFLLLQLMQAMDDKWNDLAISGFMTCGIFPLDPQKPLQKVSRTPQGPTPVSPALLSYLKDQREVVAPVKKRRGRFVNLKAGQSVNITDLLEASTSTFQKAVPQPSRKKLRFDKGETSQPADVHDSDSDTVPVSDIVEDLKPVYNI